MTSVKKKASTGVRGGSMRCSSCGSENPDEAKFCDECAAPFAVRCAACGAANRPTANFCKACAAALTIDPRIKTPAVPIAEAPRLTDVITARPHENPEVPEGERKMVTALFADIKGSMELMEDLDPEEARAIVDPALKLMIAAVHRYDGYVVQSTGDGIFAMFGAPLAHEDHPQRALHAALRMLEELRRYAAALRERGRAPVEIRVGVNTGEIVVRAIHTAEGHAEYTPIGHATNLASRMQSMAATGTIAVTEETRKFCEGYFTFRALGPTRVKGVTEAVNVHEVTGLGVLRTRLQASARRGLSKFVGREAELSQMRRALDSAKSGRGQIVAAVGEAGVGKSRLFYEFQAVGQSEGLVLESLAVAHAKASAYLPLVEMLKGYFDLTPEDDVGRRREKIGAQILNLDRALEETLPHIFALLEVAETDGGDAQMDPEVRKRLTLDALRRLLLRESLKRPLILIFQDLHWLDEGSRALLNVVADSIGNARVLMLVNYRPEFTHDWGNKSYYTQLRLDPLGTESAEEMLNALLGDGRDLLPLKRVIVKKTEGNPFFMEEIVQALFEEEALLRNGEIALAKPLSSIQIPATVQAVLASRIDRLPPAEKDLLSTLAVIGKEFPLRLIRHMAGKQDDELQRMLSNLRAAEFIYEQPAFPEIAYVFKHALSQQVAYGSALQERRKAQHSRVARVLQAHFPETVETQPELIAHHCTEAGLDRDAIPYWQRAGERALRRGANPEAISHLNRGLELLKTARENTQGSDQQPVNEDQRCALLSVLAEAQKYSGAHLEAEETFLEAAAMAEALGSTDLLVRAALGLAEMSSDFGFSSAPAIRFLEHALPTFGAHDLPIKVKALAGLAHALGAVGIARRASEYALQAVAMARRLADPELLAEALMGALIAFQGPEHAEQRFAYTMELQRVVNAPDAQQMRRYERFLHHSHYALLYSSLELGDMPTLDAELDAWSRWQEPRQEPFGVSMNLGFRAMRALMLGRFSDSESLAQQASSIGQRLQTNNVAGISPCRCLPCAGSKAASKNWSP
jgi:class 3 adenylate cyclase